MVAQIAVIALAALGVLVAVELTASVPTVTARRRPTAAGRRGRMVAGRLRRHRGPATSETPTELARLARLVGGLHADELHRGLRPRLRMIAAARLELAGVDLDAQPEAARRLLGRRLWEIVRPDREPPREAYGPGLSMQELSEILDRLESI